MWKGSALRSKRYVFALYVLPFERFSRSLQLTENGGPKGIPNQPKLITLGASGLMFEILGCFRNMWRKNELWCQQKSLNNLKICKLVARGSNVGVFVRVCVEGARRLESRFYHCLAWVLHALPSQDGGGGFVRVSPYPPTPPPQKKWQMRIW